MVNNYDQTSLGGGATVTLKLTEGLRKENTVGQSKRASLYDKRPGAGGCVFIDAVDCSRGS